MQSGIFMGTQWVNIANQNLWWIWKQIAINRQSVKQNLIPSNLTAWISFCLRSNGSNIFCLPFHSISFYIIEHLATPLCLYCSIFELYHHRMQFFHDFCRLCPFLCTFELSIRHIWKCIFFFFCRQLQSTGDIECGRGWQQKCDNYSLDLNTSQKTWAYNTFSSIMFFVLWVVIPGTNARRVNFPLNSFLSSSLALTILIHFIPVCSFFISQAICLWCIWCWTLW